MVIFVITDTKEEKMLDSPLSKYLRLLRTTHENTQDDLAKALGVTRANYSHYENARLIPPTEIICKIAAFYDAPIDELLKLTLMSLEERKDTGNNDTLTDPVIDDNKQFMESGFEKILKSFLDECTDMKNVDLNKWVTIEDREVIFHFHKLSRDNKKLLLSILRIMAITDNKD